MKVTTDYLVQRTARTVAAGYDKPKWIVFCERMLAEGYLVELREAQESVSKYITVWNGSTKFCVRFSNHGAHRLPNDPCDFFVGKNSFGTTNTEQAIKATLKALGPVESTV